MTIIISNIVSNAVKYSNNEGTINIELLSKNDTFVLTISDNGIGIAEEDFGKIFNPFYRSKTTHHPEIKGTGLGLSIVKRLCDLLKIQFKIAPNIDKGITFTLFINK
jgi:signal transduction histidine kinase